MCSRGRLCVSGWPLQGPIVRYDRYVSAAPHQNGAAIIPVCLRVLQQSGRFLAVWRNAVVVDHHPVEDFGHGVGVDPGVIRF